MNNLILLGEYGSVAQGTATNQSDHDYMGVVVEKPSQVLGLANFETKRSSDAKQGEKSKPGESDTTFHGLRKFASLAANGNPTVGSILFLPQYETLTWLGEDLLAERGMFWSKRAGAAYLGYLHSQIGALDGARGVKRPEVVAEHGYDVKFAYHAYRLGVQGVHYMLQADPIIPMQDDELELAIAIRAGQLEFDEVMLLLDETENRLRVARDETLAPDQPDYDGINGLLQDMYPQAWGW